MTGVVLGGVFAGLALGMLGAGGTIIGLPMFLYLGGPQGHTAFGTNALGVTLIAAILLIWRVARRQVNLRLGIAFAIPGLLGIAIGARLGLVYPATKLVFLLSLLILVVAGWIGYLGFRQPLHDGASPAAAPTSPLTRRRVFLILPTAIIVGVVSGFFAIGGGFLVVPGLAFAGGVDLRVSARSSLVPIVAFAALDAIEYVLAGDVQFAFSGVMIAAGIAGGAAGIALGNQLPLSVVQKIFAIFLTLVAAYMIGQHV